MKVYELIYSVKKKQTKLKIFNPEFVANYKHKYKMIYNGKVYALKSTIDIDILNKTHQILKLKLITFGNLPDQEYVFFGCDSLLQFYKF